MTGVRQFCTFTLADHVFGIDVLSIQEIIRQQEMTRVPLASSAIRGLINLRGQIVMAIDLRHRLGLPPLPSDLPQINVVMRTADRPVSLLVDDVGDILALGEADLEPPPETLRGEVRDLINGISMLKDRLLLVLDPERVADFDAAADPVAEPPPRDRSHTNSPRPADVTGILARNGASLADERTRQAQHDAG